MFCLFDEERQRVEVSKPLRSRKVHLDGREPYQIDRHDARSFTIWTFGYVVGQECDAWGSCIYHTNEDLRGLWVCNGDTCETHEQVLGTTQFNLRANPYRRIRSLARG